LRLTVELGNRNLTSVRNYFTFQGVVVSAFSNYLQLWLIDKCGPVFVAMTGTSTFVITIILSLLIGEAVTLGRCVP
jgi:hypothetical protein